MVDTFKVEAILELSTAQSGCHSAEIDVSLDGLEVVVTAVWDDEEAYDRWIGRSDRRELSAKLNPFLASPIDPSTAGVRYEVAHSAYSNRERRDG